MATIDISRLKAIGMLQNLYMWTVAIPNIPFVGSNNVEFLVRTTKIPGKTLLNDVIRFLGKQYSLPAAIENADQSSWTFTLVMDETHTVLDNIVTWFYSIPKNSLRQQVASIKTDAYITLNGLDKDNVNKKFKILGIFPTKIPDLDQLNQATTSGHIDLSFSFSFDDVDFDPENQLNF